MILKTQFHPLKVLRYVQAEATLALGLSSLLAFLMYRFPGLVLSLPFGIAPLLGSGLAIFIAFRNNSAYGRWWEARTQWGNIQTASRVLARLIRTFADSHRHQPNFDPTRRHDLVSAVLGYQIAWVHSLRMQLRDEANPEKLKPWLGGEEIDRLKEAVSLPAAIQHRLAERIYQAMADGTLGGFDSFQLEGQLLVLAQSQGHCERIKATPLLRQYHYFTRVFLYLFLLLLPFCLAGEFARLQQPWLLPLVSTPVSLVFAILNRVGEVNENPFENAITDVPLLAICTDIERELAQARGDATLPPALAPSQGYLF